MSCPRIQPRLMAFLLGEIPAEECLSIADHIRECPSCQEELESLRLTVEMLQQLPPQDAAAGFEARLAERIANLDAGRGAGGRLRRTRRWPFWAAAMAAGFALAFVLARPRLSPSSRPGRPGGVAVRPRPERVTRRPRPAPPAGTESRRLAKAPLPVARPTPSSGTARSRPEVASSVQTPTVGWVIRVTGAPRVTGPSRTSSARCRQGLPLRAGMTLSTGETGQAELALPGGVRVRVDFDSTVTVVAPPASGRTAYAPVQLDAGTLWLLVPRTERGLIVQTPHARVEALGPIAQVSVVSDLQRRPEAGLQVEFTALTRASAVRGQVRLANAQGRVLAAEGDTAEATPAEMPHLAPGMAHLASLRSRAPWGQTYFEVWVADRLELAEALRWVAGPRSWLGVEVAPISVPDEAPTAAPRGVRVAQVAAGSPAAAAGLVPGDLLLRIGPVELSAPADLARVELLLAPGEEVALLVERPGGQSTLSAALQVAREPAPGQAGERVARANRLLAQGQTEEAAQAYAELAATTGSPAATTDLGLARELSGDREGALLAYTRAVQLDPSTALYEYNLSMAYLRVGNVRRGCEHLRQALALATDLSDARFQLGRALSVQGDLGGAREQAQSLLASPQTAAEGACLLGDISWLQSDVTGAEGWYLKAVQTRPDCVDALSYLGGVALLEGKLDEARSWTERALAFDPNSLRALNRLGLILIAQHRLPEAEAALQRAEAAHPGSAIVLHNLGKAYLEAGDTTAAVAARQQAVSLAPDSVLCHMGLAIALEAEGDLPGARTEYEATLRLDPAYEDAAARLSALLERLGETQAARRVLAQARAYLP